MKEINAADYDAWKLESGYDTSDAAKEGPACVYCSNEGKHVVNGEHVCDDCLSEEPDEETEYDGPPDNFGEPPETAQENYMNAFNLSRELHR